MEDRFKKETESYFDEELPEYSLERYKFVIEVINEYANENSNLIDIGCGSGNILELIRKTTKIKNLAGLDIANNYLDIVKKRLESCKVYLGSILDEKITDIVNEKYDFVLIGAVLHHLVGKNRKISRENVKLAITNALKILKMGGHLIILEPIFEPKISMDILFYIKKFVISITNKRVSIFSYWFNIGAPLVSYLTEKELLKILKGFEEVKIESIKK